MLPRFLRYTDYSSRHLIMYSNTERRETTGKNLVPKNIHAINRIWNIFYKQIQEPPLLGLLVVYLGHRVGSLDVFRKIQCSGEV